MREILYPFKDYARSVTPREFRFVTLPPLILGILGVGLGILFPSLMPSTGIKDLLSYIISLMAILIGFTLTCLVILTTSASENVRKLQSTRDERPVRQGESLSVYQVILAQFAFGLLLEFSCLAINIIYEFALTSNHLFRIRIYFLVVDFIFVLGVLLLNMTNIASFYLVFWPDNLNAEEGPKPL